VDVPNLTPAWVVFGFSLGCVPLSIFGFFASWTENRKSLRLYGSVAGVVAIAFLVLLVYVAVASDLSEVVTNQCSDLLTFIHEDWWAADWGGGIDCAKYAGPALVWDSKEMAHQEVCLLYSCFQSGVFMERQKKNCALQAVYLTV
jgi:hypothetical protein